MRTLYILILSCICTFSSAQQLEKWSSYYENGFIWNPALTARWNKVETGITHQKSWIEFLDAPTYSTLGIQYPFVGKSSKSRMSLGAFIESDVVGFLSRNTASLTYAYGFSPQLFGRYDDVLSMGILANVSMFNVDPTKLVVYDKIGGENSLMVHGDRIYSPNFGFGVFYNSVSDFYAYQKSHYYVGLSVRNIRKSSVATFKNPDNTQVGSISYIPHFYMNLGIRWIPYSAGHKNYATPFIEPNIMIAYSFQNTINLMASVRYEQIENLWIAGGGSTSGEIFGQIGAIFTKRSILKALVRDGALRIGAKISHHKSHFGKYAGLGYEFTMSYDIENDPSQHHRH